MKIALDHSVRPKPAAIGLVSFIGLCNTNEITDCPALPPHLLNHHKTLRTALNTVYGGNLQALTTDFLSEVKQQLERDNDPDSSFIGLLAEAEAEEASGINPETYLLPAVNTIAQGKGLLAQRINAATGPVRQR